MQPPGKTTDAGPAGKADRRNAGVLKERGHHAVSISRSKEEGEMTSTPASGPAAAPASPDRPLPGVPSVSHRFLLNDFAKISATRDAFLLFYDECTGT